MRDDAVRTTEAGRQLGVDTAEVYRLIESGELRAGKGADGLVWVLTDSIDAYRQHQSAPQST